jgi:hypothetical protein
LRSAVKIANMLGCVAPWQNLDKDVTSDNREIESA